MLRDFLVLRGGQVSREITPIVDGFGYPPDLVESLVPYRLARPM